MIFLKISFSTAGIGNDRLGVSQLITEVKADFHLFGALRSFPRYNYICCWCQPGLPIHWLRSYQGGGDEQTKLWFRGVRTVRCDRWTRWLIYMTVIVTTTYDTCYDYNSFNNKNSLQIYLMFRLSPPATGLAMIQVMKKLSVFCCGVVSWILTWLKSQINLPTKIVADVPFPISW